jgi:multisubunit Na+/H+ antiporter MnhC subunit
MYRFLDLFFMIFHTSLVIFNLFGWIWKKTRRANLYLLLLTGASWAGLGLFYGMGYCPLTDWHFSVLEQLGVNNLPNSYIKYLADRITGMSFDQDIVDSLTLYLYLTALVISLAINYIDRRKRTVRKEVRSKK